MQFTVFIVFIEEDKMLLVFVKKMCVIVVKLMTKKGEKMYGFIQWYSREDMEEQRPSHFFKLLGTLGTRMNSMTTQTSSKPQDDKNILFL